MWAGENADVVETAMIEVEVAGAEYREGHQDRSQGLKVGGPEDLRGCVAEGLKNNPDVAE